MKVRQRLSVSIDVDLVDAARTAVNKGRAANLSAWVNEALRRQVAHEARMQALDEFLIAYEAEHGLISEDEIREATRRARSRAVAVRRDREEVETSPKRGRQGAA